MRYREITETLTHRELADMIHSFNPLAMDKMAAKVVLFKGMTLGFEAQVLETSLRTSRFSDWNFYTNFMSNDPSWADYPPRNRSHITTTSKAYTGHYGDCYVMIPEADVKIAICPEYDVWFSFHLDPNIDNLNTFNERLAWIIKACRYAGYDVSTVEANSSYDGLLSTFAKIDAIPDSIKEKIEPTLMTDMEKNVRAYLDPKANGFTLTDYRSYNHVMDPRNGNEVWFTGKALAIRYDPNRDFFKKLWGK